MYIIPTPITEKGVEQLPPVTIRVIHDCGHFIAERARTARRFIKTTKPPYEISSLAIVEIDKHDKSPVNDEIKSFINAGHNVIGLMSEAGMPCIADPGEEIVSYARQQGYHIKPLPGPSSIFLALSASGLQAEKFRFLGYLSQKSEIRKTELKDIERIIIATGETQIIIETPYRNNQMMSAIKQEVSPKLRLCIAMHILHDTEKIETKTIKQWRTKEISLAKEPCIFLIGE